LPSPSWRSEKACAHPGTWSGCPHYSLWPHWDTFAIPIRTHLAGAVARPLALSLQEHTPGLVHATVVLDFAGAVEPLALGLDGAHGRWELIELDYPSTTLLQTQARTLDLPPPPSPPSERYRAARTLEGASSIPFGLAHQLPQRDPAWQRHLPDASGIDLE